MRHKRANSSEGGTKVLPSSARLQTGGTQHADWNDRPIVGWILRRRHELTVSLLPPRCPRLLEVGYGSGLLMPELARHCDDLYGIDVHDKHREVAAVLGGFDVTATLHSGSATAMPYDDAFFDCVVAESVLAHIDELGRACDEIRRVLRPGGVFVAVVPGESWILDIGLRVFTGASAKADFGPRRRAVVPELLRHFEVVEQRSYPRRSGGTLRLYTALRLRSRS
jgi:SAM-dependent methyltransferase